MTASKLTIRRRIREIEVLSPVCAPNATHTPHDQEPLQLVKHRSVENLRRIVDFFRGIVAQDLRAWLAIANEVVRVDDLRAVRVEGGVG